MKQKKRAIKTKTSENFFTRFSLDDYIPIKYQDFIILVTPLILLFIFFGNVFFTDLTFVAGDITASKSVLNYRAYAREVGTQPLWDPYIFMGMPAYITAIDLRAFDLTLHLLYVIESIFKFLTSESSAGPTLYFYILAVTVYLFLRYKGINRIHALFASIAATFTTGMIIFIPIGHNTKMITLCMIPLVFLILEKMQEKIRLIDLLLLIIIIHIQLLSAHLQEIFYSFFAVLIYFIFFFFRHIFSKNFNNALNLVKVGFLFIFATLLASAMSIDQYWAIYEYNPTSIRGTPPIMEQINPSKKPVGEGLDYEYATNWSFSPGEMLTWIMPSFYGYGNWTYQGELTNNVPVHVNTYWGQMPFVDVPQYMGILVFIFGILGFYFNRKNSFIQFLSILVVISVLISFGRTFPVLYDLMFYYFPFFNKFRVPSMILNLVQISFPILAAFGLWALVQHKKGEISINTSILKYALYIFIGLLIIFIVFNSAIKEWYIGLLRESQKVHPQLFEETYKMFFTDSLISFSFAIIGLGIALLYLKNKISSALLILTLIIITIIDLFRISSRGIRTQNENELENEFIEPEWVKEIKKDTDIYRILNLKNDGSLGSINHNSNYHISFLLQDFYGYSGAKPRAYQDLVDVIGLNNPTLWRMFNVKYIITQEPLNSSGFEVIYNDGKTVVNRFREALPRAYFVKRFEKAEPIEILYKIKTEEFDPAEILFFSKNEKLEFDKIDVPDTTAFVKINKYVFENIEMDVNASGYNLLFLGDTYYNVGWKALINGKETKIYRANHNGRAILVPPGKHKIEFKYEPLSYYFGKQISLWLNLIILVLIISIALINVKKKKSLKT